MIESKITPHEMTQSAEIALLLLSVLPSELETPLVNMNSGAASDDNNLKNSGGELTKTYGAVFA